MMEIVLSCLHVMLLTVDQDTSASVANVLRFLHHLHNAQKTQIALLTKNAKMGFASQ